MTTFVQLKSGVVVPLEFVEGALAAPEMNEIASIDRDITKTPFANTLRNEDDTLLTRGGAKGLKVYDELERDAHCSAELEKRKLAVVARDWEVNAATDEPRDVEAADFVRQALSEIQLDRITKELLDATLKGYAVGEIMWAVKDDRLVVANVIPRDQRRFVFDTDSRLHMLTRSNMMQGELMPDRKFIVHRFGGKDGTPYGLGLGTRLFWPVFFKRQGITFWLIFCDKFGSPTAVGKYPPNATPADQGKLLAMLRAIAQDAGIIVPSGTEVELLEAARSGSIDTYERLCVYMDAQISKAVLGGTMTTTAGPTGLGSGVADTQNEVRVEISKSDADLLSDTLNTTLVRWLVDYNFPGARYPKFKRCFEEEEDLSQRAERDTKIAALGFEPTEEYIKTTYGEGWVKKAAPTALGFNPFGAVPSSEEPSPLDELLARRRSADEAAFAEAVGTQRRLNREEQQAIFDAAERAAADWQALMSRRVDDLTAILEETGDLALFRERMDELLTAEPPPALVEALARASFVAHLLARAGRPREGA